MKPTTRRPTRLIPLALVSLLGLLLMHAGGQAQAAADGGAASSPAPASAPVLVIRGLRVVSGAPGIVAAASPAGVSADRPGVGLQGRAVAASAPVGLAAVALPTSTHEALKTLTSAGGDLEVTVSADSYAQATRYRVAQQPAAELHLFLNGFNMAPPVAALFAQQTAADGQNVHLRFHLDSNAEAQGFWRSIYREHGLSQPSDLHVELGWQATGPNSRIERAASLAVAVAPDLRRWAAVGLLLSMLVLMVFLIRCSDTFRDTVPSWLATARHWERAFREAKDETARDSILSKIAPGFEKDTCLQAAEDLMRGDEVAPAGVSAAASATATATAEAHPAAASPPPMLAGSAVACGLLLRVLRGKPLPRPPYSLCRLQVGLWFAFVVATGLLLWIAYGYLPAISGSVLALMGISVGSAVTAVSVEPAAAEAGSTASQGLLVDLVTGFDQSRQLHRYQSVVVNLLLLLVGLHAVWSDLDFPVFDSTWLGFLGVSGVALAAGKQFVEKPAAETRGANAAVAAAK